MWRGEYWRMLLIWGAVLPITTVIFRLPELCFSNDFNMDSV